jgi:hypothetical protein
VNLERLTGEGALDEARHDVSVLAVLARPDRVEETRDHAPEPSFLLEG